LGGRGSGRSSHPNGDGQRDKSLIAPIAPSIGIEVEMVLL
jgi:hypothetical protein